MLFTEPIFFAFFAAVFAVAWLERSHGRRKLWLLGASYLFYAGWDWRFLSLIAASTLIDYLAGRGLGRFGGAASRRALLLTSLAVNLGLLGLFKYYGFFVESAVGLLSALGLEPVARVPAIVLPVGISFYTFQTLSYTIDIYRGKLEPVRNLVDFALFVGFFPQLVAGPIVRAADFLPQLERPPRWSDVAIRRDLTLFLVGFVKKACIADNVAPFADRLFAAPETFTALAVWTGVALYAVQIYCDFSGYTDMAIACAGLLGYRLARNFDFPYLASSVADFWHRWHVSLSTWLRDYLYVPLGGSRGSRLATHRNLMLTMLLGGLWHGAAWTFVAWGLLHGLALAAHREWRRLASPRLPALPGGRLLATALTLHWILLTWIFFRAQSFADAAVLARAFLLFQSPGPRTLDPALLFLVVLLVAVHLLSASNRLEEAVERFPDWAFAGAYGAAAALAVFFLPLRTEAFIYFQF
ncbi:MAG TPA: MBOAT family O-acyltransferase [Thermoanaerobaculia bacterium]|nr:MBOAT family O-acyltransferase [Thermoanaerobaculia bacterium]